jgi:hypothetical protein
MNSLQVRVVSTSMVAGSAFGGTNGVSGVLGKESHVVAVPVDALERLPSLSLCLMLTRLDVYVQGYSYQITQSVDRAGCVNQLILI